MAGPLALPKVCVFPVLIKIWYPSLSHWSTGEDEGKKAFHGIIRGGYTCQFLLFGDALLSTCLADAGAKDSSLLFN